MKKSQMTCPNSPPPTPVLSRPSSPVPWPPISEVQDAKESSGCSPSRITISLPSLSQVVAGSEVNLNKVKRQGMSTGRSAVRSRSRSLSRRSKRSLGSPVMQNSQDQKQQETMSGRNKQESQTRSLNLEPNPSIDLVDQTGSPSGTWQRAETLMPLRHRSEFVITGVSGRFARILRDQLEWSELASFSGAQLVLESQGELGKKLLWTVTLRTLSQSFGVVTAVRKMLLSMNLEEESRSVTYCDGWIDIRSMWRLKALVFHSVPRDFGLQVTSRRRRGTQT